MSKSDLFYQVASYTVLFLLVWQIISSLYLKPFFALLAEREERTSGDEKRSQQKREQTRELIRQVEEKRSLARLEGIRLRDEQILQGRHKANAIIKAADDRADNEFQQAKAVIDLAKAKALAEVDSEAARISELIVGKMLTSNTERTLH